VCQVLTLDVLHHQELPVLFQKMIAYARQCGVFQAVEQARLAFDRFAVVVVHAKRFLDRDDASKALVRRDVHSAHAALTDLPVDAIALL
jgi:hypothetical protein